MATTVVIQQPLAGSKSAHWDTGLFSCCEDMNICCYGFWCCPCFACDTSGKFGENHCLPLLDIFSPAILSAFGMPLCAPPATLALRVAIRHRYGIKGTLCRDIFTSCFCVWCSWCQMAHELKKRKRDPAVVKAVTTTQVHTINQQSYVIPVGPANVGPQPGYGNPPGYGAPSPAGYVLQPQGPFMYQ